MWGTAFGRIAVVAAISIVGAACGQPVTSPLHEGEGSDIGDAALASMSKLVGDSGWVSSAPIPGGGAVVYMPGVKSGDSSAVELKPEGITIDRAGRVTATFDLPEPILESDHGAVVVGRSLIAIGRVCHGAIDDSEERGQTCGGQSPGSLVGYRVDIDSGRTTELSLPDEVVGEDWSPVQEQGVYRSAGRVVLVTRNAAQQSWQAWQQGPDDAWKPIEAPASLPCQIGDDVVEMILSPAPKEPGLLDHDVGPDALAPQSMAARVLSGETAEWREAIPMPDQEMNQGTLRTPICGGNRLSIAAEGAPPDRMASYDPSSQNWSELSVASEAKALSFHGREGLDSALLYEFGDHASDTMRTVDLATGAYGSVAFEVDELRELIPLSTTSVLGIEHDGSYRISDVEQ
jgi:hypothetical protein